jgi:GT2 family glycosyltransferase
VESLHNNTGRGLTVSAVVLHYHREELLSALLTRLRTMPVNEVVLVDNGSAAGLAALVAPFDGVRLLEPGRNLGVAARTLAARAARGDVLLMLDDDAFPLPGAVEAARAAFDLLPRLGVVGGLVRDVDATGTVIDFDSVGSFDWLLRAGQVGPPPAEGFPTFFFPEGASFVRRDAYLETGGYLDEFFSGGAELDLATRLLARGWDVRYLPTAVFDHQKTTLAGERLSERLRLRVRNQVWYFWLRFPAWLAAVRIPAYLTFDLVECAYRGEIPAWRDGVADAWRERAAVRRFRHPLPRRTLRRAELNRGRMHLRLLTGKLTEKLSEH